MENQIFWSEMGYVLQIACCTLPLELPEYPLPPPPPPPHVLSPQQLPVTVLL